ncbi:hypothetical protein V8G54_021515, partial [Vigna mungo]
PLLLPTQANLPTTPPISLGESIPPSPNPPHSTTLPSSHPSPVPLQRLPRRPISPTLLSREPREWETRPSSTPPSARTRRPAAHRLRGSQRSRQRPCGTPASLAVGHRCQCWASRRG